MTQTSQDHLRDLTIQYQGTVKELNEAIDEATVLSTKLAVARARVAKGKNMQELVQEMIRCEKQLLQAGRP